MFSRRVMRVLAVTAGLFAMGHSRQACGGLVIIAQSAHVELKPRIVDFVITFNEPPLPALQTLDSFGRPQGSFQYEINTDWTGNPREDPLKHVQTIIRGDEIHVAHALRIRGIAPPDPDPAAGGWGLVRGTVPFEVNGNTLRFTAGLGLLGDDNGIFAYRVFTTDFGETSSLRESRVVPLPPAALSAALTLAAAALAALARGRWSRFARAV